MKSLCKRSALVTSMLFAAFGAQAENLDFETSDSDTIVVGATAERVTLRVAGFKNQQATEDVPEYTKLGSFYMSSSSGLGKLAVTYGAEHKPTSNGSHTLGTIKNDEGHEILTTLTGITFPENPTFTQVNVDGTPWSVYDGQETGFDGGIYTMGSNTLSAGVYPITLRAALYQP